ncbi:SRR1 family protein [Aspergillus vadensis CBS 113365]|uniref:SRR1-like domain-containing protein n=1 Tax=Aspergillus vadensis (strain CBS 113365 / IMI 142717 / IBT 24658) TaxID=1448311 RepID=A0A319BCA8_ASPVC|nr:hypothetical protein BO88DRAFT_271612 [Aspergillus vadensis CBS 113365]PYH69959.1 hypothetical protein BO88DRAFT_271612 [Aspergillus vadensis CBS 113365]
MPHTSRKKHPHPNNTLQAQKRFQITDATTGWTHVTTSGKARRCARTTKDQQSQSQSQSPTKEEEESLFHPAEAPPTTTLDTLKTQFTQIIQRTWKDSSTCDVVGRTLHNILLQSKPQESNTDNIQQSHTTAENKHNGTGLGIDSIICIGLGSPSGFLRGGWVDRRLVSLYQLAALVDVMASISSSSSSADPTIKTYAQDPVFNTLDKSLLSSLDITVLESPLAFEKVTPRTFLFCPGAERTHLEQLLALDPAFVFGGPLEDVESEVVSAFVKRRRSSREYHLDGNGCLSP